MVNKKIDSSYYYGSIIIETYASFLSYRQVTYCVHSQWVSGATQESHADFLESFGYFI